MRFWACSSDSRIRMPAPSPTTKPSRSASNGRLARCGSSLRVESAFIAAKPPMPIGVIAASRAAADHHFGVAALDEPEGIADGVRRCRASRGRGGIGPARAVANGNHAGGQIDDGRGNEKRGDASRAAFEQLGVLALDDVESADARGDVDARGFGDRRSRFPARPCAWQNPRRPWPTG